MHLHSIEVLQCKMNDTAIVVRATCNVVEYSTLFRLLYVRQKQCRYEQVVIDNKC
jgi:hypothetical protein